MIGRNRSSTNLVAMNESLTQALQSLRSENSDLNSKVERAEDREKVAWT